MSNRTLIEINHDFWMQACLPSFVDDLIRYLGAGDSKTAERLEQYGIKVIAMRHHSEDFRIPDGTPGFLETHAPNPNHNKNPQSDGGKG